VRRGKREGLGEEKCLYPRFKISNRIAIDEFSIVSSRQPEQSIRRHTSH